MSDNRGAPGTDDSGRAGHGRPDVQTLPMSVSVLAGAPYC
jgi:hypothetical protein